MGINLSKVNFKNLIRDLGDMYTYAVPEVVLVELVANSLDARASEIAISYNPKEKILVVEDNGLGMTADQFGQYHDLAAGLKSRGEGIGFAGLGAKISFNVANRVITETRSKSFAGGSNWYLKSEKELAWEEIKPSLNHNGTKVQVYFNQETEVSYTTSDLLKNIIMAHYLPLFDVQFLKLYETIGHYPKSLKFMINGQVIDPFDIEKVFNLEHVERVPFKDKSDKYFGYGVFGLSKKEYPFNGEKAGVAISVHGKIVTIDFLGQFPGEGAHRIFGLAEVPPLIKLLNTSKENFIKDRSTAKFYQRYFEPIKNKFREWLKKTGFKTVEAINNQEAVRLEQELKKMINQLPELFQLFGSSVRKTVLSPDQNSPLFAEVHEGAQLTWPAGDGEGSKDELGPVDIGEEQGTALVASNGGTEKAKPISRTRKAGVRISFLEAPENKALGWLDDNVLVINIGHPSYLKVKTNNVARKLHNIFSIAVTLDRELKQQDLIEQKENFTERLMSIWGTT